MEIALFAGLGFLGKAISDSNKGKSNTPNKSTSPSQDIYQTTIVNDISMQRARLASANRELSKDPNRTNIIPPLYPQSIFKRPTQEFGTITDMAPTDTYNFSDQLDNLIWKKKQEVAANNDVQIDKKPAMKFVQDNIGNTEHWAPFYSEIDMTYNVVPKEEMVFEQMEHFTNQRDFSVYNDYNEQRSPLAIELFTGSSKNYFPKQENVLLFEPQKGMTYVNGAPAMTGLFQDRYNDAVKLERRNERPFEQRQVGPGLNLNVNQDSLNGFHDTTRILPRNIDELRRADKKQSSKTEPVNHGKLGEQMPVLTPWKKHTPDSFRTIEPSEYLPGSSQVSAARVRDNINLRVGNRAFSQEEIGIAKAYVPVFSNTSKGDVQASQRELYREPDNQNVGYNIPKISHNIESFVIPENQRNKTNINYTVISNPIHSKTTTQLSDQAKTTQKQTVDTLPQGAAFGQNQKTKIYNQDEAKDTLRQMLKNINKEVIQGNNNKFRVRFQDEANTTTRQTTNYEESGNISSIKKLKTMLQDSLRTTTKQLINIDHDGFIGDTHNKHKTELQDDARTTTRQQTIDYDYVHHANNVSGNRAYNQEDLEENLPVTLRNISKIEDYMGSAGLPTGNVIEHDFRNAHTNASREEVSKDRSPTQTGLNQMATLDNTAVNLKKYQDLRRAWVPTATQAVRDLETENGFRNTLLKNKTDYNDRLSYNLTQSLNDNPLVINNKKFIRT